ncbi:hypothetical protein LY632_06905 [Erythrobacter sp. SDW2]|uniref:hypothetical protein n=1 Tax=Erythrobacter sp. SDW2 TaxID=2907154 RepID=UPI001F3DDD65|nr:hypothetical protein [Erythrobacter sp. SDW2]UIP08117.1 hypothetical protein LY632_06905 [Erythrobacter sp. SDW2]
MNKLANEWRHSRIERLVFEAWWRGSPADFKNEHDFSGARPAVSGNFLADLLAGRFGLPSAAGGILWLRDLCILDGLSVAGIRGDASGTAKGPRLRFENCVFEGPVQLSGSELDGVRMFDCQLRSNDIVADALSFDRSTIQDALIIERCEIDGIFGLDRTHLCGLLRLSKLEVSGTADMRALRCDERVEIENCSFASMNLSRADLRRNLSVFETRFRGQLSLFKASVDDLHIDNCRFAQVTGGLSGLSLSQIDCRRSIFVERILLNGPFLAVGAKIGRTLTVNRFAFQPAARSHSYLDFKGTRVGQDVTFSDLNAPSGALYLEDLSLGAMLVLARLKLRMLTLIRAVTGSASITDCRISGVFDMAFAKAEFIIALERISNGGMPHISGTAPDYAKLAADAGGDAYFYTYAGGVRAASLKFRDCCFSEGLNVDSFVGNQLIFERTIICSLVLNFPLSLQNAHCKNVLQLNLVGCNGGISCGYADCESLELIEVKVAGHNGGSADAVALGAGDMSVRKHILFGSAPGGDGCSFEGGVLLDRLQLARDLLFYSIRCRSGYYALSKGLAVSVSLVRAHIGGDLAMGQKTASPVDGDTIEFDGCVRLSAARIEGDLVLSNGAARAIRPANDQDSSLSSQRYRRVHSYDRALSLTDGRIEGSLTIRNFRFDGMVDLGGAHIQRVLDRGGAVWTRSGLKQGDLVLDGLTYGSLAAPDVPGEENDDYQIAGNRHSVSKSEVDERLQWLDMQFDADEPEFRSQPFEQLAHYFSGEGDERARRMVLISKREMQRKHGGVSLLERGLGWLLKATSNYGYSPARAILCLSVWFGIGTLFAWLLGSAGAIQPNSTDLVSPYPVNYFVLAVDAAIPIIDLEQDSMLTIDPVSLPWWASENGVLIGKALYEIIGMLLLSVTVLTLTGSLREKE